MSYVGYHPFADFFLILKRCHFPFVEHGHVFMKNWNRIGTINTDISIHENDKPLHLEQLHWIAIRSDKAHVLS